MQQQQRTVLLASLALLAAFLGLAALATGGSVPHGTAAAGERQTFYVATLVAVVAGLALLVARPTPSEDVGRLAHALAGLVVALALSLPAVWVFGYPVSTPADDTSGCGSLSSPVKLFDEAVREPRLTPTCADRLRKQSLYSAILIAPSALLATVSIVAGFKGTRTASNSMR